MESDFSFRIRFTLPDQERINVDEDSWELLQEDQRLGSVSLTTVGGGPIRESTELVLRGRGYSDDDTARAAAETVRDLVTIAFARARVAADFGDRAPTSMFFDAGLKMLEAQHGARVLNDVHGVQVYQSDPTPRFARVSAKPQVGRSAQRVKTCVEELIPKMPRLEGKVRTAYDLYAASFRVGRLEARFLLLMVALETFIDRQPRSEEAQELVAWFLEQVDETDVSVPEKESLRGSLRWMMDESIGQAGRRLASTLADHRYADMEPDRFFTKCYEVRGKLVHGDMIGDQVEGVTALVAPLETFVGDLISVPFLGPRKG
jgi:hypothetical protein